MLIYTEDNMDSWLGFDIFYIHEAVKAVEVKAQLFHC